MVETLAKLLGIEGEPSTYVAEVVRKGDTIILPDDANIPEIIEVLQRKHAEESQKVSVKTSVDAPPWDGALALQKAIKEELGVVITNETKGMWGEKHPPTEIEVEIDLGKTLTVKWGEFALPSLGSATATTGVNMTNEGVLQFNCTITCLRKYQDRARHILNKMRMYAETESIHKGKAFSIRFLDDDHDRLPIPMPKFFDLNMEAPIFRRDLERAIERNVFVPLQYTQELRAMGESLKRGVLFAGKYGTGKTMMASFIAREAVQKGWTFIYVKDSAELPYALKYAQKYQPVVVFAEDVDRVAGLERTDAVNNLLNQLDGVDSKNAQIMTILTSNFMDKVNEAMRRPGRIDLILQVLPPDEETVGRMVHHFSREGLEPNAALAGIERELAGLAPAYVREAVGRARLEALRRTGKADSLINGDDLEAVAKEVRAEKDMFE
ncbi:MAG TPA: ATP-binding protein, partial [Candidatus Udaeobacter sp.]|nr:ATP-binding protein [Candidatus Udaeobacter sp.]